METKQIIHNNSMHNNEIEPPPYSQSPFHNVNIALKVASARQKRLQEFIDVAVRPHIEESAEAGISTTVVVILPRSKLRDTDVKHEPYVTIDKWVTNDDHVRMGTEFVCDDTLEFLRQREMVQLFTEHLRQCLQGNVEVKSKEPTSPSPKSRKSSGTLRSVFRRLANTRPEEPGCSSFTPGLGWKSEPEGIKIDFKATDMKVYDEACNHHRMVAGLAVRVAI